MSEEKVSFDNVELTEDQFLSEEALEELSNGKGDDEDE